MADFHCPWQTDLSIDSTGDFAAVFGGEEVVQRVVRRFLSNPAGVDLSGQPLAPTYIFDPSYGGGARRLVDKPITQAVMDQVKRLFIAQAQLEPEVASDPQPIVTVTRTLDGGLQIAATVFLAGGGVAVIPSSAPLLLGV
jgi:hypothetical protein